MKRFILWLSIILISLVSIPSLRVQAEEINSINDVTVHLKHNTNSNEETTFSVYGISASHYEKALSMGVQTTVEKTKAWLKENGIDKAKEVLVSSSNQTTFNLPRYNNSQELMYYVILQKYPNREGMNGKDIYEATPTFLSLENYNDEVIFIETKRIFIIQTPYFFKYSSGDNQIPLEQAEFAFYQLTSSGDKEYLSSVDPIEWKTGISSKEAYQFTSDKDGLVAMPDLGLELGEYYFEETKAPDGYTIGKGAEKVALVISETEEGLVMTINGEVLEGMQAGEFSSEVIEKGQPRVLNDRTKEPPKKEIPEVPKKEVPPGKVPPTNTPFEKDPPRKGFLPQTGENLWAFSSVGLLLMFVALVFMKRGKENE